MTSKTNVITSRLTTVICIHITFKWLLLHVLIDFFGFCCAAAAVIVAVVVALNWRENPINKVEQATEHEKLKQMNENEFKFIKCTAFEHEKKRDVTIQTTITQILD